MLIDFTSEISFSFIIGTIFFIMLITIILVFLIKKRVKE
jgi:hypothetical protein